MNTTQTECSIKITPDGIHITATDGTKIGTAKTISEIEKLITDYYTPKRPQPPGKPEWATKLEGNRASFTYRGIEFAYCWCPPGIYIMGSPENEPNRYNDDEGQVEVQIHDGFWMQETPITETQLRTIFDKPNNSRPGDHPATQISYLEANLFCAQLSSDKGVLIEMPTEEEWEYACRAGTTGPTYGPLDEIAVYNTSSSAPVKTKKPNAWGLFDMLGNVWELTRSIYRARTHKGIIRLPKPE